MELLEKKNRFFVLSLLLSGQLLLVAPGGALAATPEGGGGGGGKSEAAAGAGKLEQEQEKGAQGETGSAFVEARAERLKEILSKVSNEKERDEQLKALAGAVVDYGELGRRSLRGNWDSLTTPQRDHFVKLLRELIEASYLKEAGREPNFSLVVEDEEPEEDGSITWVYTLARSGRTEFELEFRLMQAPAGAGGWIAYDLVIDGVSMVANYRKSFGDIIKKEGFDGLVTKLENRLAEVRKESKKSPPKAKSKSSSNSN